MGFAGEQMEHLPVIDILDPSPDVASQLLQAASKWGFVYIKSVGLDLESGHLDHTFDLAREASPKFERELANAGQSRRFFKSPVEEKAKYRIGPDVCRPASAPRSTAILNVPLTGSRMVLPSRGNLRQGRPEGSPPSRYFE